MNITLRNVAIALIALLLVGLLAAPAMAADSGPCFALSFLQSIAGDRTKIIQLSIVFVLIGCGLLFIKRNR